MESENAPALAALDNDHHNYTFEQELGGLTAMPTMSGLEDNPMLTQTPRRPSPDSNMHAAPWLETPQLVTDHGVPSNLRDSHGQQEKELPQVPAQPNPAIEGSTAILDRKPSDALVLSDDGNDIHNGTMSAILQDSQTQLSLGPEAPSTPSHMEPTTAAASPEHITEEAFAMLKFNDSHCYVRSTNLVIGRDMNFLAKYQQQKKDEKKKRARALQARRALDIYAREPSQPSLMGDDDPSGESLEGRPEPTGPLSVFSVFSEQGGPVAYNNPYSDDENEEHSRVRRRDRRNKSSSNTSVAPKSLMAFAEGENLQAENRYAADGTLTDPRQWAQLPVHPPIPADIKKISREHLLFHYDSDRGKWLLDVIGNGAIFNGVSYMKDTTDLELNHNDEIFIATLGMRFMLPESVVNESEQEEEEEEEEEEQTSATKYAGHGSSTSPARRLSELFSADDSSDDDDEPLAQVRASAKPPVPKLKLKFKKPLPKDDLASEPEIVGGNGKGKGKGKAAKSKDKSEKAEKSEKSEKKPEKKSEKKPSKNESKAALREEPPPQPTEGSNTTDITRKPSDAVREAGPSIATGASTEQSPPVVPHVIDPTSVLANLAPDQLPEKRKGPGRPPKNGLLSKRDESGVKRKTKEFERRGVPVPALETLIAMVRQEQKAKDAANKAQARGEPVPDMPMPSIESSDMAQDGERGRQQTPRESHAIESGSPGADRKLSPRLPRPIPREASPIKPVTEFTEEELKKPNMTYIYIIDEVLQNVEGGKADLQAIYDKIMKRWPFYKYKVGSLGWQSSVRHNLLSCDRFRDAGKSGKGKLWAINHDHPLDNKKRKPSPPPRPMQMPMQNGQMPMQNMGQNQFGQPHYNGQYQQPGNGQQPYAGKPGSGPYYSPYTQSGNYPPNGAHGMSQGSNGAYPANASQNPQPHVQQPPAPPNPFQPVIDAILSFRTAWLASLSEDSELKPDELKAHEDAFARGTNYFSTLYHGSGDATVTDAEISSVEPFMTLKSIFEEHKYLFEQKPAEANGPTGGAPGASSGSQPVKQELPAESNGPVSGMPPAANQAPMSHGGPAGTSNHPSPMPLQDATQTRPLAANGNSTQEHDTQMTSAADLTAAANSITVSSTQLTPGTEIPTPSNVASNGAPASLPMPSVAMANAGPSGVSMAPPASVVEPSVVDSDPAHASSTAEASGGQSSALPLVAQASMRSTDESQPGAGVSVVSPAAPMTAQQAAPKPTDTPIAVEARLPATPATGQTLATIGEPSMSSGGTKRSADDSEAGVEDGDSKRLKLS